MKVFWFLLLHTISTVRTSPNIVIFMADDLAIGDVGIFGNTTLHTPNIDSIGQRGVLFNQHLAAAATCSPSRAAFLTGRYPVRSGMAPDGIMAVIPFVACTGGLPDHEVTIAELAKQAGYQTALIGKWHLGIYCNEYGTPCHHPLNQGFDYYYGMPLTNLKDFGTEQDGSVIDQGAPNTCRYTVISTILCIISICGFYYQHFMSGKTACFINLSLVAVSLFVLFFLANQKLWNSVLMRNYEFVEQPVRLEKNLTLRLVKEGSKFITQSVQNNRPFLLFMSWIQVHTALHASAMFNGKSKHGRYGDNVEELDWSVGEVLKVLEGQGLMENTLVYFTSDNGGHNEEHDIHGNREGGFNGIYRGGKGQGGMDGGLRVPTAAMWSGVISPGTVIHQPTSLMDVFPTISNILNVPPPDVTIDGKDLMPVIANPDTSTPHPFLYHYCNSDIHAMRYHHDSITWKIHYAWPTWNEGTEGCQDHHICGCSDIEWLEQPLLFNIVDDPSERKSLDLNKHKNIVLKMEAAKTEHLGTVIPVQSEFNLFKLIWRPWLQPCCNFPWCNCEDE